MEAKAKAKAKEVHIHIRLTGVFSGTEAFSQGIS
jgi:hypothetical protein